MGINSQTLNREVYYELNVQANVHNQMCANTDLNNMPVLFQQFDFRRSVPQRINKLLTNSSLDVICSCGVTYHDNFKSTDRLFFTTFYTSQCALCKRQKKIHHIQF